MLHKIVKKISTNVEVMATLVFPGSFVHDRFVHEVFFWVTVYNVSTGCSCWFR